MVPIDELDLQIEQLIAWLAGAYALSAIGSVSGVSQALSIYVQPFQVRERPRCRDPTAWLTRQ